MTTIQQEAYQLIDTMPDESVRILVDYIRKVFPSRPETSNTKWVRFDENYRVANRKKLARIAEMQDSWNGNGAKAISAAVIESVRDLLEQMEFQPEIFPTACDSIQFEYEMQDGGHLEIEISSKDQAECFYVDANGNEYLEQISADAESINRKVAEHYGSKFS
ncbi:MAG: hypothetical protein IK016_11755 [Lachnospiraceae bacterium]|nr:hypothetical protein [Lachnospiraceae bacterium]